MTSRSARADAQAVAQAWLRRARLSLRRAGRARERRRVALIDQALRKVEAVIVRDPAAARAWASAAVAMAGARPGHAEPDVEWRARRAAARALHACGRAAEALAILESLQDLATSPARRADIASTSAALLARLGRPGDAIAAAARARRSLRALGDVVGLAHVDINEANIRHRQEKHAQALVLYRRARLALARSGRSHELGLCELGIGNVLTYGVKVDEARDAYAAAEAHFAAAGSVAAAVVARYNRAYLELLAGRPQAALDGLAAARADFARLSDERGVANCDLDAAEIAVFLGILPEAESHAREALARTRRLGMASETARSCLHLARALGRKGRSAEVERLLATAAETFRAERNEVGEASALLHSAELLEEQGRGPEAIALARRAVRPLRRHGFTSRAALALVVEARALAAEGGSSRRLARRRIQEALRCDGPGGWSRVEGLGLLSALDLSAGDIAAARRHAARAMSALERLADDIRSDAARASLLGRHGAAFRLGVEAWLSGSRPDASRAFDCAERARRFALLSERRSLRSGRAAQVFVQAGQAEGGRTMGLRRGAASAAVGERSAESVRRPEAFDDGVGVGAIRRALGADEALVHFVPAAVGTEHRAFVVRRDGIEVIGLPPARIEDMLAALEASAERAAFLLAPAPAAADRARALADETAGRLAACLLDPLRGQLEGMRRLLVVSGGPLVGLPWGVLPWEGGRLGSALELIHLPNSSWMNRPRRRASAARHVVAFGVGDEAAPRAEEEARAIAALTGGILRVGSDATSAELRALAPKARVLHLSCHGSMRRDAPLQSALRLADRWVTAAELEDLPLNCELVVLSACQVGALRAMGGGQFLGPVRALLRAGARCVVASPWSVPDELATTFFGHFHRALADGLPATRALQLAAGRFGDSDAPWARSFGLFGAP